MAKVFHRITASLLAVLLVMSAAACAQENPPQEPASAPDIATEQVSVEELADTLQQTYEAEEKYIYNEPLYDLPEDHHFVISLGFDPAELGYTKSAEICGIYQNSDFTRHFYFSNTLTALDNGRFEWEIAPPDNAPFAISSTLYEYSRYIPLDVVDYYLFQKDPYSSWGNGREYYMVQWVDYETGAPLAKPIVTVFTIEHELAPLQAEFYVSENGSASFRWNAVEGATMYYIVEATCFNGSFSSLTPIGRSETTSWEYNNEGLSSMNVPFRMAGETEDQLLWQSLQDEKAEEEEKDDEQDVLAQADSEENTATDEDADDETPEEDAPTSTSESFYGVIAVSDEAASVVSQLYSEKELASLLPYTEAYYTKAEEGINANAYDSIGLLPTQIPVVMCDNKIVRRPINYLIDSAKIRPTTYMVYEGELENPPPEAYEKVIEDVLYIPYTIDGTNLQGKFLLHEFDESTYEEELAALKARQDALRGNSGTNEVFKDYEAGVAPAPSATVAIDESYAVTANSALSEYIARNMLAGNQLIDLSRFNESSSRDLLMDAWQEAVYQNPLILGVKSVIMPTSGHVLTVNYYDDSKTIAKKQAEILQEIEKILSEIITPGMTDLQKEFAINQYLCDTAQYDQAALDSMLLGDDMSHYAEYLDSFTAYGVLLNKKGVCASYSGAFKLLADAAGLECIVVTGLLNGTISHAWNRVRIGGEWHTVDVTNNNNEQVANALLNLPDSAASMILLEDDKYVLNAYLKEYTAAAGDREYYRVQGKYFSQDDIVDALVEGLSEDSSITLRTDYDLTDEDFQQISYKVMARLWGKSLSGYTWMGVIHLQMA